MKGKGENDSTKEKMTNDRECKERRCLSTKEERSFHVGTYP